MVKTKTETKTAARKPHTNIRLPVPLRNKRAGQLLGCGKNEVGQLGLGEEVAEKLRPVQIPGCTNCVDISAGGMHSLYLDASGVVYSFGCNDEGALGRDTSAEGSEYEIAAVELPGPVVRMSTGDSHSAVLLEDGRCFAWGSFRDSHGNMGLTLEGNKRFPVEVVPRTRFVQISSGADHLAMLTDDGQVFTVGCGEQGQLGRVTARSSGGETRRGKTELLRPGKVWFNKRSAHVMDAIWATTYCTFARVQGTKDIVAFGLNNYAQLSVNDEGNVFFNPKKAEIPEIAHISGGQHHTVMLTPNHSVLVIGRRDYGRLGLGPEESVSADLKALQRIDKFEQLHVVDVCCGESCSFARTKDGSVYAWGFGYNSQLGLGHEDDVWEPVLLTGAQVKDKEVFCVKSGGQHTLFLVAEKGAAQNGTVNGAEKVASKVNGIAAATTTTTTSKPVSKTTATAVAEKIEPVKTMDVDATAPEAAEATAGSGDGPTATKDKQPAVEKKVTAKKRPAPDAAKAELEAEPADDAVTAEAGDAPTEKGAKKSSETAANKKKAAVAKVPAKKRKQ